MGFTDDFLTAMALHLHAAGAGTWRGDGTPYGADETAIVLDDAPQSPDQVIALAAYGVEDDPTLSDDVIALQVRTRTAGNTSLDDAVFDALHGLHDVDLPTGPTDAPVVHVTQVLRRSYAPLGFDGNSRRESSQNFYCTVWRPSPHRP